MCAHKNRATEKTMTEEEITINLSNRSIMMMVWFLFRSLCVDCYILVTLHILRSHYLYIEMVKHQKNTAYAPNDARS